MQYGNRVLNILLKFVIEKVSELLQMSQAEVKLESAKLKLKVKPGKSSA